jgi:hypothetical protein
LLLFLISNLIHTVLYFFLHNHFIFFFCFSFLAPRVHKIVYFIYIPYLHNCLVASKRYWWREKTYTIDAFKRRRNTFFLRKHCLNWSWVQNLMETVFFALKLVFFNLRRRAYFQLFSFFFKPFWWFYPLYLFFSLSQPTQWESSTL